MGKATRFTTRKEIRYAITQLLNDRLDCTAYANRVRPTLRQTQEKIG